MHSLIFINLPTVSEMLLLSLSLSVGVCFCSFSKRSVPESDILVLTVACAGVLSLGASHFKPNPPLLTFVN